MPGVFSPPHRVSYPDMHHGTCVTHVPWCMPGSLTSSFIWSRWRGKRCRHSRRMRSPQFYVSGERRMSLISGNRAAKPVPLVFVTSYSVTYCIYIPRKPGCAFQVYQFPLWWLKEYILCLIIIIKLEVWTIIHFWRSGHETLAELCQRVHQNWGEVTP